MSGSVDPSASSESPRPSSTGDLLPGSSHLPFSLSMLGWALNEEASVEAYINRAGAFLEALTEDFELILIDDGSTDRTWEIAAACQRSRPWLRVYKNDRNRGSGYNTKRAIGLATKDYVFWQTVDWAYDLRYLARAMHELGRPAVSEAAAPPGRTVDILQGVRIDTTSARGIVDRRSDTAYKGFVSVVNYALIRLLFRLPLRDYQNVTVYPRTLIQSVVLETESAFTNPECLLKTWWRGATFKEVHVPFVKRQIGRGTGTRPGAILAAIRDILRWWTRWIVLGRRHDRGRGRVIR